MRTSDVAMGSPMVVGARWLDVVVSRTLLFILLTGVIVAAFAVSVMTLGREAIIHNTAMSVLLGAAIAALVQPVYTWGVRGVDWLLFGDRADPYKAIVRGARAVQTNAADSGMVEALVGSVRVAMRLSHVRVDDQGGRRVAGVGAAAGRRYEFPVRYRGTDVGRVTVARGGDLLTAGDRRLLAGMLPLLGAALDSMRREAELRGVRERLVSVHEEERRRLRRDLHDGFGPALAAVSLGIDAARARLRRDPEQCDRMLDEVQTELRESVGEMRRLIDALRPAALDQRGLVEAVRVQVGSSAAGIAVVVGGDPGELPAAVETAAYRIAVEAVTNAARHCGGHRCTVTFTRTAGALEVVVLDDGSGRGSRPEGVGIASMRERADELGGTLTIEDVPGCRVWARLPWERTA